MKRVLFISPHYPPDSAAGAHRARVLAPYLEQTGWRPTILTLDESSYETTLDHELAEMSHHRPEVIRVAAVSPRLTRAVGIGDLGLRGVHALRSAARRELAARRYDALYLTTYPVYPALIAPGLAKRFNLRFVLDLQDPWVGAWGDSVGGGTGGTPDIKSRLTRTLLARIERRVVPHAHGLTSVSSRLLQQLTASYPMLADRPQLELPIGIDPCDFAWVKRHPRHLPLFDAADGNLHLCYVGTVLPLAVPVLESFLRGVGMLCDAQPAMASRLRVHFIGTSNQASSSAENRVLPLLRRFDVPRAVVDEHASRIPFADALRYQMQASALLILGSSEARYTASKVAPALAAGRPLMMLAHRDSDAVRQTAKTEDPAIALLTFRDEASLDALSTTVASTLARWLNDLPRRSSGLRAMEELTAPYLASRLASMLNQVVAA